MPVLDVSDAFDPSFMDAITVTRRVQGVDNFGRATVVVESVTPDVPAVVGPSSPTDIQRLPEGSYMNKAITIITQHKLQGPSPGYYPDLVTWSGADYIVASLDDFSRYGQGFISVVAVSKDITLPSVSLPA